MYTIRNPCDSTPCGPRTKVRGPGVEASIIWPPQVPSAGFRILNHQSNNSASLATGGIVDACWEH